MYIKILKVLVKKFSISHLLTFASDNFPLRKWLIDPTVTVQNRAFRSSFDRVFGGLRAVFAAC